MLTHVKGIEGPDHQPQPHHIFRRPTTSKGNEGNCQPMAYHPARDSTDICPSTTEYIPFEREGSVIHARSVDISDEVLH